MPSQRLLPSDALTEMLSQALGYPVDGQGILTVMWEVLYRLQSVQEEIAKVRPRKVYSVGPDVVVAVDEEDAYQLVVEHHGLGPDEIYLDEISEEDPDREWAFMPDPDGIPEVKVKVTSRELAQKWPRGLAFSSEY